MMLYSKEVIPKRFDSYVRTILKNKLKRCKREEKSFAEKEIVFSDLSYGESRQLFVMDSYSIERFYEIIETNLFNAVIHDELIHKALLMLKENSREIVILKYWGEITDSEIGKILSMSQQMVNYYRNRSLEKLKDILKELTEDENRFDL